MKPTPGISFSLNACLSSLLPLPPLLMLTSSDGAELAAVVLMLATGSPDTVECVFCE